MYFPNSVPFCVKNKDNTNLQHFFFDKSVKQLFLRFGQNFMSRKREKNLFIALNLYVCISYNEIVDICH